ncbi:MAG: pilus assembly protein PilP [Brachymonas sp.]|jgi:type IV pilus assembly protein PilP
MSNFRKILLVPLLGVYLAGCGNVGGQSVDAWMHEQQSSIKPSIKPLPEPKVFAPKAYAVSGVTDPFNNQKLLEALRRATEEDSASVALLAPEKARRKEALEDFPLDSISMVGYLNQKSIPVSLVTTNGLLYQVKVGNYLGQNYGRILSITDTGMTLREIVQDSAGEWIEKETTLAIQDTPATNTPKK